MSVVKIFAGLGLEPWSNISCGFNWAGKIEQFSKVSIFYFFIYYLVPPTKSIAITLFFSNSGLFLSQKETIFVKKAGTI